MKLFTLLPFCLLGCTLNAFGQITVLDPTFGAGGLVSTDIGSGTYDDAYAITLQPDGMILAAGTSGYDGQQDIALARYWMDGSLDPAFGVDGKTTVSISFGNDIGMAIALQPDGKILVGGYAYLEEISFVLVRFLADGTVDTDFGTDGVVVTAMGGNTSIATGVAVQDDGKILLCGGGFGGFSVVRYEADGAVDMGFGTDGLALCPFPGASAQANAIGLQSDGRIILAGYASGKSGDAIALAAFDGDGLLDADFGTDGTTTASWNGSGVATAMAIGADDGITVVGSASTKALVARFTPAGALDLDFYNTGIRQLTLTDTDMSNATGVTLQTDGKPLIAGYANYATNDFVLIRMENDGTYDYEFGTEGVVSTDFTGTLDRSHGVLVQPNGAMVVAGGTYNTTQDRNFAMARYLVDFGTGVAPVPASSDAITVHPNPAMDRLHITVPDGREVQVRVLDLMGRTVLEQGPTSTLDISRLAAGAYTLVTTDAQAMERARTRFVKQ